MKYYFNIQKLGHYGTLTIKNNLAMNYMLYQAKLQSFQKHVLTSADTVVLYLPKWLSLICAFSPVSLFSCVALLGFSFPPTLQCVNQSPFLSLKNYLIFPTIYLPLLNSYGLYICTVQFILFSLLFTSSESVFPSQNTHHLRAGNMTMLFLHLYLSALASLYSLMTV